MAGAEHYKQAQYMLAKAEETMRSAGDVVAEPVSRGISLLLQAAALHVDLAKVAVAVQTGRMAPQTGREWEEVLVVPANFAEARGEIW